MNPTRNAMSWEELAIYAADPIDQINGLNNPYSSLRLFNKNESEAIVTLYRDNHAWCPYCQKVWIWLELKKIPYRIKKVTMRCYGEKERWYLKKVPSGMLPAIEIENHVITESDEILFVLEEIYGPLGQSLNEKKVLEHRALERELFSSWCNWLCRNSLFQAQEVQKKENFKLVDTRFAQRSNHLFGDIFVAIVEHFTRVVIDNVPSQYFLDKLILRHLQFGDARSLDLSDIGSTHLLTGAHENITIRVDDVSRRLLALNEIEVDLPDHAAVGRQLATDVPKVRYGSRNR